MGREFTRIQATDIKPGNIVVIGESELEVTDVRITTKRDSEVALTTKEGHNGKPGQVYNLASWQKVEVAQ
jgi:uncharacterized protein YwlG (UPF0340 family)